MVQVDSLLTPTVLIIRWMGCLPLQGQSDERVWSSVYFVKQNPLLMESYHHSPKDIASTERDMIIRKKYRL